MIKGVATHQEPQISQNSGCARVSTRTLGAGDVQCAMWTDPTTSPLIDSLIDANQYLESDTSRGFHVSMMRAFVSEETHPGQSWATSGPLCLCRDSRLTRRMKAYLRCHLCITSTGTDGRSLHCYRVDQQVECTLGSHAKAWTTHTGDSPGWIRRRGRQFRTAHPRWCLVRHITRKISSVHVYDRANAVQRTPLPVNRSE